MAHLLATHDICHKKFALFILFHKLFQSLIIAICHVFKSSCQILTSFCLRLWNDSNVQKQKTCRKRRVTESRSCGGGLRVILYSLYKTNQTFSFSTEEITVQMKCRSATK